MQTTGCNKSKKVLPFFARSPYRIQDTKNLDKIYRQGSQAFTNPPHFQLLFR